ncbi:MAG: SDR family oxidoreductase [Roseibium sp.]
MHVLLTGASGSVGRFILDRLLRDGFTVTILGRRPVNGFRASFFSYDLADPDPRLPAADALVHCALMHEPGRFRGGEGDDPERFRALNVDGSLRLFQAARDDGCRRAVFLSSRAVYGDHRSGETLRETDRPQPDSLYGEVKLAGEQALEVLCDDRFQGAALRATGVYGVPPGKPDHKWCALFKAFEQGEEIAPRAGTEVHGADLAAAVVLMLTGPGSGPFGLFNVSDLLLDRRELLSLYCEASGAAGTLPDKAEQVPGVMATEKLEALGWSPGGRERLKAFLVSLS